jgi:hypothetical protein
MMAFLGPSSRISPEQGRAAVPDIVQYQTGVQRMLDAGEMFSDIEDYIAGAPLSDRCKSALWLFGWAHQDPQTQLRLAKETLALVSDTGLARARERSHARAREVHSHRGPRRAAPD